MTERWKPERCDVDRPLISFLLCTVRPDQAYLNNPDWHVIGAIVEDLQCQTFDDFELVVVDGLYEHRTFWREEHNGILLRGMPPKQNLATRNRKVAISAYRNTGIAACRGELIVNLDDCCRLPTNYAEHFWSAWTRHRACISPVWRDSGDTRPEGRVMMAQQDGEARCVPGIYGFGSYPREKALVLNGYSEAYDLGQGLEDTDFSTRLLHAGVRMGLVYIPGFKIHPQSAHDPRAVENGPGAIVKCCNRAWTLERKVRHTLKANTGYTNDELAFLAKPICPLYQDGKCGHHGYQHDCAYPELATIGNSYEDKFRAVANDEFCFNLRKESEDVDA